MLVCILVLIILGKALSDYNWFKLGFYQHSEIFSFICQPIEFPIKMNIFKVGIIKLRTKSTALLHFYLMFCK